MCTFFDFFHVLFAHYSSQLQAKDLSKSFFPDLESLSNAHTKPNEKENKNFEQWKELEVLFLKKSVAQNDV